MLGTTMVMPCARLVLLTVVSVTIMVYVPPNRGMRVDSGTGSEIIDSVCDKDILVDSICRDRDARNGRGIDLVC
jgi:hypothetical protein